MKNFATSREEETGSNVIKPMLTRSRTRRQLISICFVCLWNIWLNAISTADWLSQERSARQLKGVSKSFKSYISHWSSHVVDARAQHIVVQSESLKTFNWWELLASRKMSYLGAYFRYRRIGLGGLLKWLRWWTRCVISGQVLMR